MKVDPTDRLLRYFEEETTVLDSMKLGFFPCYLVDNPINKLVQVITKQGSKEAVIFLIFHYGILFPKNKTKKKAKLMNNNSNNNFYLLHYLLINYSFQFFVC